eukprot:RCo031350
MTTTGCAQIQHLIPQIRPSVFIVEEAAEILEAQLIACLQDCLQQVVLIGDHEQLQPSTAVQALSDHNNLGLSLFERLVNNGFPSVMLKSQRRMKPELCELVQPVYRGLLQNHPNVLDRDFVVPGMR